MKKLFTLTLIVGLALAAFGQAPQKMSYQCVVRNAAGALVASHAVGLKISILKGTATGTVVFSETYSPVPQTNANGLLTVEIGGGTATAGTFAGIDWSAGPYFLKTEMDPAGGTSYTITGTSQLLSVPYAMYAKTAANGFSGAWADITGKPAFATVATSGSYNDLQNRPSLFSGSYNDLTNKPVLFDGTWTSLTGKPALFDGTWASLTGKPVLFDGTWTSLTGKPAGFADGIDNVDDADNSITNEIQALSLSGTVLSLSSGGGTVTLPSSGGGDNWGTQTVVTNTTLTGAGTTASPLAVANTVITPSWSHIQSIPAGFADGTDNIDDADNSITNEIQILNLSGTTLSLSSGGGSVTLPSSGGGDNWGTQVVMTNNTLTGNGTTTTPLAVANSIIAPLWTNVANKPTTLSGYGITDAMSTSHVANGITSTMMTNWNTAFSWGNHTGLYRPVSYVPSWSEITSIPAGFSDGTDNVDDADNSITNEIQTLNLSGTTLTLSSGGGSVTLPSSGGGDNWGTQVVVTDASLSGNGTTATPLRIADNGVTTSKILDATIGVADIADNAVNSSKILDASVGTADIASSAITMGKIADNAVGVSKLPPGAASDNFLRGDGSWAIPTVGSITETDPTWEGPANLDGDIGRIGDVGIGTVSPTALLHTNGTGTGGGNVLFVGEYKAYFPGNPPVEGAGTRMMWYPDQAVFRMGAVSDDRWDAANLGSFSTAIGYNCVASGSVSFSLGSYTTASNTCSVAIGHGTQSTAYASTALGYSTTCLGYAATAMGDNTIAQAYVSTAIGQYNVGNGTSSSWEETEPIFEIGIGRTHSARKNAMTVLKNGYVGIGTVTPEAGLHIKADGWPGSFAYLEAIAGEDAGIRLYESTTPNGIFSMMPVSAD